MVSIACGQNIFDIARIELQDSESIYIRFVFNTSEEAEDFHGLLSTNLAADAVERENRLRYELAPFDWKAHQLDVVATGDIAQLASLLSSENFLPSNAVNALIDQPSDETRSILQKSASGSASTSKSDSDESLRTNKLGVLGTSK